MHLRPTMRSNNVSTASSMTPMHHQDLLLEEHSPSPWSHRSIPILEERVPTTSGISTARQLAMPLVVIGSRAQCKRSLLKDRVTPSCPRVSIRTVCLGLEASTNLPLMERIVSIKTIGQILGGSFAQIGRSFARKTRKRAAARECWSVIRTPFLTQRSIATSRLSSADVDKD